MVSNTHAEHELRDLRPLLTDPLVNEVVINPDGVVWFERADTEHMVRSEHQMPLPKLMQLSNHLAADSHNKLGPKHPLVSGSVEAFGQVLRVQVVVPPAVEAGASISIRRYVPRILEVTEIGFLEGRQISVEGERRQRLEAIAAHPGSHRERPELGAGVRLVRHRGLYVAFLVNEVLRQVEVIGFPNVHRELARSVAASLEAWRGAGPETG